MPTVDNSLLRQLNERRVLDALRNGGACSRADITRQTGISAATVSKVVATLLDAGVLEELDAEAGGLGRPGKRLRLAVGGVQVLGATLGVRRSRVFAAGLDGRPDPDSRRDFDTPGTYPAILDALGRRVRELAGSRRTLGLGVAVPGLIDEQAGRVLLSPNLPATNGRQVSADLADRTGLPTAAVQEARALCLAERYFGAARDLRDFVMIDVGDGIGAGIVADGRLLVGRNGVAGEFGHMILQRGGPPCGCGRRGCLETLAGERVLTSAAAAALGRAATLADVAELLRNGEPRVAAALDEALQWLAVAVGALINGLNPEAVVLCGTLFTLGDEVLPRLEELTRDAALPVSLEGCRLVVGQSEKDLGAVAAAIDQLLSARGPVLND